MIRRAGRAAWTHVALLRLYSALPVALLAYAVGVTMGVSRAPLMIAAAVACALAGGYAYNDLRDQRLDRLNRPGRPLVSGRMSESYVRRLIVALFAIALLLAAATASPRTIACIVLLIASACAYSDRIKSVAGIKNVFVGLWCGVLPWTASLDGVTAAALPAVALVALFITQKELLADVYDRDGDAAAGVRTIPVLFGARTALAIVAALNAVTWLVARNSGDLAVLPYLRGAAEIVAIVNVLAIAVVFSHAERRVIRAYLELQKTFMIGGCVGLGAALAW